MGKLVPARNGGKLYRPDKGETMNPNGQPRKGISLLNNELKQKGYSPASKQDIEANYMSLLQLERSELEKLSKDSTKPILVTIIAKSMLDKKGGAFNVIEKMLDRGIGKAIQPTDNKYSGNLTIVDGLISIKKNPQKKEK